MNENPRQPAPNPPGWFWEAVEEANGNLERFRAALDRLAREQVPLMYAYYTDLAGIFAEPAYVVHMSPGMSEDGALDVGAWIVSQGREYFHDVYSHPEKVPDSPTPGTKAERLMRGEIIRHYLDKYGEEMPTGTPLEYGDNA